MGDSSIDMIFQKVDGSNICSCAAISGLIDAEKEDLI